VLSVLVVLLILTAGLLTGCFETESQVKLADTDSSSNGQLDRERILRKDVWDWLSRCINKIYPDRKSEDFKFNGIEANDVVFLPKKDPLEEIFAKCMSVEPLSSDKAKRSKQWLIECLSYIQSIRPGMTRKQVNELLVGDGGLIIPDAHSYSLSRCNFLKVRVEYDAEPNQRYFEVLPNQEIKVGFNEDDKVKAVSLPYIGLGIMD